MQNIYRKDIWIISLEKRLVQKRFFLPDTLLINRTKDDKKITSKDILNLRTCQYSFSILYYYIVVYNNFIANW